MHKISLDVENRLEKFLSVNQNDQTARENNMNKDNIISNSEKTISTKMNPIKTNVQIKQDDLSKRKVKIQVDDFNFYYGSVQALKSITMNIKEKTVVGIIGPSGCGKSTYLRCFNRMNDTISSARYDGSIIVNEKNILDKNLDVVDLRRDVGMVFQKSNPFPKSIFENVAYGLKINGVKDKAFIEQRVESSLKSSAIWDEVKDRLNKSAFALSGGQQQRLCIARALAVEPEILLLDEPASALDPIATSKIEELIHELKEKYTIIIVTHNMQQAARVSDYTAFFMMGELVEYDVTNRIFTNPAKKITEDYVTGRFG